MAKIDANELNWIEFQIGKIKEEELTRENKKRLARQRAERAHTLEQGIVPVKPFPGGIVNPFGEGDED